MAPRVRLALVAAVRRLYSRQSSWLLDSDAARSSTLESTTFSTALPEGCADENISIGKLSDLKFPAGRESLVLHSKVI